MPHVLVGLELDDLVYWTNAKMEAHRYKTIKIFADRREDMHADTEVWLDNDTGYTEKAKLKDLTLAFSKYKYTARMHGYVVERKHQANVFWWRDLKDFVKTGQDVKSDEAAWRAACEDNGLTLYIGPVGEDTTVQEVPDQLDVSK